MSTAFVQSAALLVWLSAGLAVAQESATQPSPPEPKNQTDVESKADQVPVPLRVDIAIVRYQGEKRVSRLPYTIYTTAEFRLSPPQFLRMGNEIPVRVEGKDGVSTSYRNVGTDLDCKVRRIRDGAYELSVSVEHTSLPSEGAKAEAPFGPAQIPSAPLFRSFRGSFRTVLGDGRQSEFIAATDPISGETIKVEVKLTVVR